MIVLVMLLWPIFLVSWRAGFNQGKIDKTPELSRLQAITFSTKDGKKYIGKLVSLKNGLYFIREVTDIKSDTDDPSARFKLWIYRAEDLQDVTVTGAP